MEMKCTYIFTSRTCSLQHISQTLSVNFGDSNSHDKLDFEYYIKRNFERKIAQFRCRTCAQDAREARRLISTDFEAVPCPLVLSETLLQALGAHRAQNCAEIRRKFHDFNGKSLFMNAKFRETKHR